MVQDSEDGYSLLWVFFQHGLDDFFDGGGERRRVDCVPVDSDFLLEFGLFVDDLVFEVFGGVAEEGKASEEHGVEDAAEGPDVDGGFGGEVGAVEDFWGHVAEGACAG